MLRKIAAGVRMTPREYRANIDGLNIFFGAVLGFVLAGSEALTSIWFGFLLGATAGIVISILYIPASNKRAPNTSSLGGGGAGGDARSIPAATARRATRGPAAG